MMFTYAFSPTWRKQAGKSSLLPTKGYDIEKLILGKQIHLYSPYKVRCIKEC